MSQSDEIPGARRWLPRDPKRLFRRGHPIGDFLEAHRWRVLEREPGRFKIEAHLPPQVKNPRGVLFGGFTPTYVDLVAIRTGHSLDPDKPRWMLTASMRVDYLEPIGDERFLIESRVIHSRGRTHLVEVRMSSLAGSLLAFALVSLRERPRESHGGPA